MIDEAAHCRFNRRFPRLPGWPAAAGLVLALAGCDEPRQRSEGGEPAAAPPAAEEQAEPRTVALVMKTLTNPFFVEMERGARRAEADFGIDLLVRTAAQETSIEQQIDIVDDLVRSGIDAIVIAPGDSIRLIPVLRQAQQTGVVVVNIDNRLDPEFMAEAGLTGIPFISVDNEEGAYLSARYIADRAEGPAEAVIIEGIRDADNARARLAGARRAFEETPEIALVASETANWKIDEGYTVARSLFEAHPEVDLVFAANDMMALGAIRFLGEAGLGDRVQVAAFDALDEALEAIRSGSMAVTIDQQAAEQGYLGVEYAVRMLDGEEVPAETMVEVRVVSRESLAAVH
jgi:ribose transport system substrate-binding protein